MIATPLLTKINANGGTLYTFTSASKDLTRVFTNNSDYEFKFSKFACLNLPPVKQGDTSTMNFKNSIDETIFEKIVVRLENADLIISIKVVDDLRGDVETCEVMYGEYNEIDGEWEHVVKCPIGDLTYTVRLSNLDVAYTNVTFDFVVKITYAGINPENPNEVMTAMTNTLSYENKAVGSGVEKGLYLDQLKVDTNGTDINVLVAEQFQNYILNFESVILNQKTYDSSILKTPAERIFFKWLRQIGAIRFKNSETLDIYNQTLYEEDVESYYNSVDEYQDRTVQYIGDINAVNQVDVLGDTFGEVFLYIPGRTGASTKVLFRTNTDTNYKLDIYSWGGEKITGREEYDPETMGYNAIEDLDAIYDYDTSGDTNYYYGDVGYGIDFVEENYPYSDISQMNANSYINFEFNCILIYYDLTKKSGGKETTVRNLYGVLFLDNFVRDERSYTDQYVGYMQSYPKFRSSELDEGNSYALKLALKIDTAPSTTLVSYKDDTDEREKYYNTDNEEDMALYTEAMVQLQKCVDIFYTQQNEIYRLQDRIDELESMILTIGDVNGLQNEIDIIKTRLDANGIVDTSTLLNLITENSNRLSRIMTGKYPTKLTLDTSKLYTSDGLKVVANNIDDSITLENTLQKYNLVGKISLNTIDDETKSKKIHMANNAVSIPLQKNSNLIVLDENEKSNSELSSYEPLVIEVNAVNNEWELGQSCKFMTSDDFKFNAIKHKNVVFKTMVNVPGGEEVDIKTITIKDFSKLELTNMSNKTEIEFICIDNDFTTDGQKFLTTIK